MWGKGNPLTLLEGMQVGAATLEKSVEIPKKLELPMILQLHFWVFTPKIQM